VLNKTACRWAAVFASALMAGAAHGQSDTPWAGAYAGVNAGGASMETCNAWTPSGTLVGPASPGAFSLRNCSGGGLVGGVQIGENFQTRRLVFGVGADLDFWSAKTHSSSLKYAGQALPAGTYTSSGKLSPSDFIAIGPRIGYAGDQWLPYLRMGAILGSGSSGGALNYAPTGSAKPLVSWNGGRSFAGSGWVAGGGTEMGLNGAWSISAEYLHVNLGKGSSSAFACNGSTAACAAFSGTLLESAHDRFTANLFRVGINYWFGYWGP
jgi:outer membrane immunogenic protein